MRSVASFSVLFLIAAAASATDAVDAAIRDLSQRLDVPVSSVTVVSHSEVVWPDSSLGCPRKGMAYTQRVVEGERLLLTVGDHSFAYHSGRDGRFFLCENTGKTIPAPAEPLPEGKNVTRFAFPKP